MGTLLDAFNPAFQGPWSSGSGGRTRSPSRASVLRVGLHAQDGVQFLGGEPQQVLQVAHEAVHVTLPRRLVDDVLVVVIAQAPAQLLVVHLGLVFPFSPPAGHLKVDRGKCSNLQPPLRAIKEK